MQDDTSQEDFGPEQLIRALGAENCSPDLKGKILAKFGAVLFKRLLLLLPDVEAKKAIIELQTLSHEAGMQRLINILDAELPDAQEARLRVYSEIISEFAISTQSGTDTI